MRATIQGVVRLDLRSPDGLRAARSLVQQADILIENLRPGKMAKLGLGAAAAHALNPSLVYLSMPGFASSDVDRQHLAAWEGIISASAGVFKGNAGLRQARPGLAGS